MPPEARQLISKTAHALDIVRTARARGLRFGWVGVDAGYGKEPGFLRALEDANEVFVADVHRTQRVWTEDPGLHVPDPGGPGKRRSTKLQAAKTPLTVEKLANRLREITLPRGIAQAACPRYRHGIFAAGGAQWA